MKKFSDILEFFIKYKKTERKGENNKNVKGVLLWHV